MTKTPPGCLHPTPDDPHGRLALADMAITGHTLEQLHGWLYCKLADNVPRADLRYLAGTPAQQLHQDLLPLSPFRPGERLFGVLVV